MIIQPPPLEPRLQRRYLKLVKEHSATTNLLAAGLRSLPSTARAFSSTQAAWRFFSNPAVTLQALAFPLIEATRDAITGECSRYALVAHDWSNLNYFYHASKLDRIRLGPDIGYQLMTALIMSDRTGLPISPACLNLWSSKGIHTTMSDSLLEDQSPLDMVGAVMEHLGEQSFDKPLVHIIDRAGDSVRHYREWDQAGHRFLVRARDYTYVVWQGQKRRISEVAASLQLRSGGAVEVSSEVCAQELIGETEIVIERAGRSNPRRKDKNEPSKMIKGEAIKLRLIYVQLRLPDERVIAEWMLVTNLPTEVKAEVISEWYYWRWRIETFFKLMKNAGHNLEQWQQESAEAISKRILIAGMAAVVVWRLMREEGEEAEKAKEILIRLSGRQVRKGQVTASALLSGLWVLLAMMDICEQYELYEIKEMARIVLPDYSRYHYP